LAAVVTVVAVMSTLTLEGGRVVVSNDAAATVTASGSVADGRIDEDNDPAVAAMSADDAASSMLEEEKRNKNETNDICIQAFDAKITNW